jgi:four helix bundle protein
MRMAPLRDRTKSLAVRVIHMYSSLPNTRLAHVLGQQALRSGTSVAANFREASRARSDREFIAKLGLVEQELDELALWCDLLTEAKLVRPKRLSPLQAEIEELLKIVVTTVTRTKKGRRRSA